MDGYGDDFGRSCSKQDRSSFPPGPPGGGKWNRHSWRIRAYCWRMAGALLAHCWRITGVLGRITGVLLAYCGRIRRSSLVAHFAMVPSRSVPYSVFRIPYPISHIPYSVRARYAVRMGRMSPQQQCSNAISRVQLPAGQGRQGRQGRRRA